MMGLSAATHHDVFLSHSHQDAEWVERLATRLEDEHQIRPWLDRWDLVPGTPWQQAMARGLDETTSCVVCIGQHTPQGWFEKEIQRALNRQAGDSEFRVIPVLLPNADPQMTATLRDTFLDLNTWVSFAQGSDPEHAFHLLVCGVKGKAPGRWVSKVASDGPPEEVVEKLRGLQQLRRENLVDDAVALAVQRKLLYRWFLEP